jgi:superfamily II DNA or RNA helicase
LDIWFGGQRNDKDVVTKLHTGCGKTLVALLMAQSVMNEHAEPVLYLAPTNQLAGQALAMSREYGIPALPWAGGPEISVAALAVARLDGQQRRFRFQR